MSQRRSTRIPRTLPDASERAALQAAAVGALCGASILGGSVAFADDDSQARGAAAATAHEEARATAESERFTAALAEADARTAALDQRLAAVEDQLMKVAVRGAASADRVAALEARVAELEAAVVAAAGSKAEPEVSPASEDRAHVAGDGDEWCDRDHDGDRDRDGDGGGDDWRG